MKVDRRQFLKGLMAAAVVVTAPIPKLGPALKDKFNQLYGIEIDAKGASVGEVYNFCRYVTRAGPTIKDCEFYGGDQWTDIEIKVMSERRNRTIT